MATEHHVILRRVGWTLIVLGALDVGFMIYCIVNRLAYASSLNVFAIVAGIYLLRGHLGAVRVVTWYSAFTLTGVLLATLALLPWLMPLDYWRVTFQRSPMEFLFSAAALVVVLGVIAWTYLQLRSPAVVRARENARQSGRAPTSAFVAGCVVVLAVAVISHVTLHGEAADRAVQLAAVQHGSDYRYFVTALSWSNGHVRAQLVAYNERETKDIELEWQE